METVNTKISVVIPLYNKAPHIQRALQSILRQTFQNFEIIVVNDGSTDDSEEKATEISDARIRLVNQENSGVSAARNRGIEESTSELIAFLDADDEWMPRHLETVLRLYNNFPDCGAFATARISHSFGGKRVKAQYREIPGGDWEGIIPNYFRSAIGKPPLCSSTTVVKAKVFDDVGRFPDGEIIGEDFDMWARIALRYPIAFSNYSGAINYHDAVNRSHTSRFTPEQYNKLAESLGNALTLGELPDWIPVEDIREYRNLMLLSSASASTLGGEKFEAMRKIREASSTVRYRKMWLKWKILASLPRYFVILFWHLLSLKRRIFSK